MKTLKSTTLYLSILSLVFLSFSSCFRTGNPSLIDNAPEATINFKLNTPEDLYTFLTYSENSYPLVSAHRGGAKEGFPENSINTFAEIAKKMPAIIECDVRMSKDSILVLMHDNDLERTTTGKGKVIKKTYQELRELNLVDPNGNETSFKIPTLEAALNWGKNAVIYTLDVKQEVPYQLVIDLIRKTKSESNSIIITYTANQAAVINKLAPDLMISATIKKEDDLIRLNNLGIPDNKLIAFVGTSEPSADLYKLLQLHGIKSILGTIGNLDRSANKAGYQRYAEYIDRGADVLSTDNPYDAYKALEFFINKRNIKSEYVLH